MQLIWLPEAQADIQRLFDFLVDVNPDAAIKMLHAIKDGADRLLDFPELGRRMDDDTSRRELVLPFAASAYVLRYRIEQDTIVIIRVWHGRERRL